MTKNLSLSFGHRTRFAERLEEKAPVILVGEDRFPAIASRHQPAIAALRQLYAVL